MLGCSFCPKRACILSFFMEADFCSSPSCWATPDPIAHSSIIWRVGMLLIVKRAQLVGLRKPVTDIAKPNFSLVHPSIAPKVIFPWFLKDRTFIKDHAQRMTSVIPGGTLETLSVSVILSNKDAPIQQLPPCVFPQPLFQGSIHTRSNQL